MSISTGQGSLRQRGLSVLRGMGALVAIRPEQTYVATSIPGLGPCKSTYCQPQRRELPRQARARISGSLGPLLAACVAALGVLSGCAYRPVVDLRDVTDRGQTERNLADCQIYAAPVSPGVSDGAGAFTAISGRPGPVADAGDMSASACSNGVLGRAVGADPNVWVPRNGLGGRGDRVFDECPESSRS
jgi:hypothetical protein